MVDANGTSSPASSTTAVEPRAILTNPEALTNPSAQDEANALQPIVLDRDEGGKEP